MSYTAFVAIMLVCIYLAILAQNLKDGTVVWICSVSLFMILIVRVAILLIKGVVK